MKARLGSSVQVLIVAMALAVVLTYVSTIPAVTMWIWKKWGTYPDLSVVRAEVSRTALPLRGASLRLVQRAEEEAERGATAADMRDKTEGFRWAQAYAMLALQVADAQVFLVWGVGVMVLVSWLSAKARPRELDVDSEVVKLDLSGVGRVGISLAERELPELRGAGVGARVEPGLSDDEMEAFEFLRNVAIAEGVASEAVKRELARLPSEKAALFRKLLGDRAGVLEVLRSYRKAWDARERGEKANRDGLNGAARRLLEAGVPPELLEMREELREMGELTALRERLLRILAAYPEHPASTEQHSAYAGGLIVHTRGAVRRALEMLREGVVPKSERKALLTAVITHDIGKISSYAKRQMDPACSHGVYADSGARADGGVKEESEWVAIDGLHAQNGALVLGKLAEFWEEHSVGSEKDGASGAGVCADAERILLAVAHEHDPESIPTAYSESCRALLDLVKEADGSAAQDEGAVDEALFEKAVADAVTKFPGVVQDLNINRAKLSPRPDGVYEEATGSGEQGEEMLLLLEPKFRDELTACLEAKYRKALGLSFRRRGGVGHRAWLAIARALAAEGALPMRVRGVPVDDNYLVSAAVGKVVFRGLFPVNVSWLRGPLTGQRVAALTLQWSVRHDFPVVGIRTGTSAEAARQLLEIVREREGQKDRGKEPHGNGKHDRDKRGARPKKDAPCDAEKEVPVVE